jgi:hypothetical protein
MPLTKIQSLGITDGTIVNADINASAAIAGTKISGSFGKVLQVVSATDNTSRTTSSTSFVTASNTLSVSITPSSASSKIFVMASTCLFNSTNQTYSTATIFRDSTNLGNSNLGMGTVWSAASSTPNFPFTMHFLDSPSSTSALTYQVYVKSVGSGTTYLNGLDSNNQGALTAFEIAG